jgi:voltage-gated potassium channel
MRARAAKTAPRAKSDWITTIRHLYQGRSRRAEHFRYGLIAFDAATIAFLVASSFFIGAPAIEVIDALIGLVIFADFSARMLISRNRLRELAHPANIADVIVVLSFLAPVVGEGFAFLRVVRTLRLLRSYTLLARLQRDVAFFRRHQDASFAVIHLAIFLFVMTALVYETQHRSNPNIGNYVDALYFTVTTLTTTGFGDITLQGTTGRLLSVLIMIFGVSLFVHLIRTLFRPERVVHECPSCGLSRHEPDSVHCRHCGTVLNIPSEGFAE